MKFLSLFFILVIVHDFAAVNSQETCSGISKTISISMSDLQDPNKLAEEARLFVEQNSVQHLVIRAVVIEELSASAPDVEATTNPEISTKIPLDVDTELTTESPPDGATTNSTNLLPTPRNDAASSTEMPTIPPPEAEATTNSDLSPGFPDACEVYEEKNTSCYWIDGYRRKANLTYDEAEKICRSRGGYPASFTSKNVFDEVVKNVPARFWSVWLWTGIQVNRTVRKSKSIALSESYKKFLRRSKKLSVPCTEFYVDTIVLMLILIFLQDDTVLDQSRGVYIKWKHHMCSSTSCFTCVMEPYKIFMIVDYPTAWMECVYSTERTHAVVCQFITK